MGKAPEGFAPAPGETIQCVLEFQTGGFLGLLLKLLGPLMNADITLEAVITNHRIWKKGKTGKTFTIALAEVATVYRNTSSDSLAVVSSSENPGLLIARVANCDQAVEALRDQGVACEDEAVSPRRRSLV